MMERAVYLEAFQFGQAIGQLVDPAAGGRFLGREPLDGVGQLLGQTPPFDVVGAGVGLLQQSAAPFPRTTVVHKRQRNATQTRKEKKKKGKEMRNRKASFQNRMPLTGIRLHFFSIPRKMSMP